MGSTRPVSATDRPRMARHHGWTAQDDEDLLHLMDSGFEMESIAWALDRTPGTIRARLVYLHPEAPLVRSNPEPVVDREALDTSEVAGETGP